MPSTVSAGVTTITVVWPSSSSILSTVLFPPGVSRSSITGAGRSAAGCTSIALVGAVMAPAALGTRWVATVAAVAERVTPLGGWAVVAWAVQVVVAQMHV